MLEQFIEVAEQVSEFTIECFGGALLLRGNILSPSDAQAIGLASSLISVDLLQDGKSEDIGELAQASQTIKDNHHNMDEEELFKTIQKLKHINPEKLRQIGEHQSKVICQCVREGSIDGGDTWEKVTIVLHKEQQSKEHNRLWVGVLTTDDRIAIINKLMIGQNEAAERLRNFRK
jgi:hypothetical protein